MGMLRPEESINKEDIKTMKEQVFGPNIFWVTETKGTDDIFEGGMMVCCKSSDSACVTHRKVRISCA